MPAVTNVFAIYKTDGWYTVEQSLFGSVFVAWTSQHFNTFEDIIYLRSDTSGMPDFEVWPISAFVF